jgi:hypothetical protein
VLEDNVPQALDLVHQEAVGATFALLVDSSGSMANGMEFVQQTAGRSPLHDGAGPDARRAVHAARSAR